MDLLEDFDFYYLDLYDIYEGTPGSLNFSLWTGTDWKYAYKSDLLTVGVLSNDTLEFQSKENKFGSFELEINATNAQEASTIHKLKVNVKPVNDPPVIKKVGKLDVTDTDSIKLFIYEDEFFNVSVEAFDADSDPLVYIDNATLFDIGYNTGEISYVPTNKDVGKVYFNLIVSDINGTESEDKIDVELTILNVNDPPTARIIYPENGSRIYNDYYTYFEAEGYDPDSIHGDKLEFEWTSDLDGQLGYGQELGVYYLSAGVHKITLRVTDFEGAYDEHTITITVEDMYKRWNEVELNVEDDVFKYIAPLAV